MTLKSFLEAMEDAGEIISFLGHVKEGCNLECNEQLVFVMDDTNKGSKKRKVSKARFTLSNPYRNCPWPPCLCQTASSFSFSGFVFAAVALPLSWSKSQTT